MTTHLVKHKKITKRQMKEDPLVTAAGRAMGIWDEHGSRILIGAGALALVGLLAFFMAQARSKAEASASVDLYRATLAMSQGDFASASPLLQEMIENEGGTNSAREAMLYLGDCFMADKKPVDAATWYRKYVEKSAGDQGRQRTGHYALGTALEDGKEFGPAATAYGEAAKQSKGVNDQGRAMLAQARCLLRAGQTAQASDVFKAIVALPGAEVPIVDAANFHLGELQATPQAP